MDNNKNNKFSYESKIEESEFSYIKNFEKYYVYYLTCTYNGKKCADLNTSKRELNTIFANIDKSIKLYSCTSKRFSKISEINKTISTLTINKLGIDMLRELKNDLINSFQEVHCD